MTKGSKIMTSSRVRASVVAAALGAMMVASNLGPAHAQTRRWSTSARSSSSSFGGTGGSYWEQCYNGECVTSEDPVDDSAPAPAPEEEAPVVEDDAAAPEEEAIVEEEEVVVEEEMSLRDRMQARMAASRARMEEMRAQALAADDGDDQSSPDVSEEEVVVEDELPIIEDEPIIEDPLNETLGNDTAILPPTESGRAALSLHNKYRAKHGAPPLKWSSEVAEGATNWAQYLAQECKMVHNREDDYGENLGLGYRDIEGSVNAWYEEESKYNYNNPGFSSATGHFTAMVWKETTDIGCAVGVCGSGRKVYVCQYWPKGNRSGDFEENVLPPQ